MGVGRHITRAVLCAAAVTAAAAGPVHAAPADLDSLTRRDRALARAEARLDARLASDRATLAATRARIDALRRRYDAQTALVNARLRAAYVQHDAGPIIALLAGDTEEAAARARLARALARADARLLRGHRAALDDLREAEAALSRRKRALAAEARLVAARRATVRARIRAERAAARARASASATVPVLPEAGEPAAAGSRGLPADILRGRLLPGAPPVDSRTGVPVLLDPPAAGPPLTVALPGQGVIRTPSSTLPVTGARRFAAAASIRDPRDAARTTASGIPFAADGLVAAHRTLPLGTLLRLRRGDREVVVRVVDRGPYVASRDLEVSVAAAAALGMRRADTVRATVLG